VLSKLDEPICKPSPPSPTLTDPVELLAFDV
jgi:hypothetical protein